MNPQLRQSIPKSEQLKAVCSGDDALSKLLHQYLGEDTPVYDFRRYLTITRTDIAEYLRAHPDIAVSFVSAPDAILVHDTVHLESCGAVGYRVSEIDHGQRRATREYNDLAEAGADYIATGLGLIRPPS